MADKKYKSIIVGKVRYMELISHARNHFKFYRMSELSNGMWLRQSGRIGTEGAKEMCQMSTYDNRLKDKRSKGYEETNDPYPHHIEYGLNHYNLTSYGLAPAEEEAIEQKRQEKVKSILDRIDVVIAVVSDYDFDSSADLEYKERMDYLDMAHEIRERVEKKNNFTGRDIELLNQMYNRYASEETV